MTKKEVKTNQERSDLPASNLPVWVEGKDGVFALKYSDPARLVNMFGRTKSPEFIMALAGHCANVSGRGEANKDDKNTALALVDALAPQDALEAMLATQMASVHIAMMRHSRLMAGAETIAQLDVHDRVFNKLGRTFTAQMEALRKHRHGGQQKVTVEHVTVNQGGQAIVGNVNKGGDSQK